MTSRLSPKQIEPFHFEEQYDRVHCLDEANETENVASSKVVARLSWKLKGTSKTCQSLKSSKAGAKKCLDGKSDRARENCDDDVDDDADADGTEIRAQNEKWIQQRSILPRLLDERGRPAHFVPEIRT